MVQGTREIEEARSLIANLLGPGPSLIHRARMDEKAMEKSEPGSGLFQWIVGGLLAVIAVLAGAIYNDLRGSIKEAVEGLSTFKIEVVKQLGEIKTECSIKRRDRKPAQRHQYRYCSVQRRGREAARRFQIRYCSFQRRDDEAVRRFENG
jgi:hypothetical protein